MTDELLVDERGPVAVIAFNRPAARNALTLGMLNGLTEALQRFAARDDLRAVVLRGAGELPFSAGYNVEQLPDHTLSIADASAIHAPVRAAADAILACPHPVIGAARKFIFGAALDIFCHCDLRLCAHNTSFCMPPNRFGFMYPDEGVHRLADVAGLSRATQMLLLGLPVTTEVAAACGLVQETFPESSFESDLEALCAAVASNAPLSMRASKRALLAYRQQRAGKDSAAVERMYADIAACLNSADVQEGRAAFREKRPPRFQGK